jgi:hypothetical protein
MSSPNDNTIAPNNKLLLFMVEPGMTDVKQA